MEKITLHIILQPGSKNNEIIGWHGDPLELKIKISAPPVEGAANKELIKFLSKELKIPKSSITITKGHKSKHKTLNFDRSSSQLEDLLKDN